MKAIQIPYDRHFETKCKLAAAAGFSYVSLNLHAAEDTSDAALDDSPEKINAILNRYSLKAVQSHLYSYDLLLSAEHTEAALEHRLMREIEVCGKLNVPWCVLHLRTHSTDGFDYEKSKAQTHKVLTRYLKQARLYGTGIAVENLYNWPGVTLYSAEYEDLIDLCDHFAGENIGICWDFGHANLMDYSQAEALRAIGGRLKCTHIHNNFKKYDLHLPPDSGTIVWKSAMGALDEIAYEGPMTLETHCLYPEDEKLLGDFARYNLNCLEFLERMRNR